MSPTISPHSSTTVGVSEKQSRCLKPRVEMQRRQRVAELFKELLATDWLQNSATRYSAQPWIVLLPPGFCPRIKSGPGGVLEWAGFLGKTPSEGQLDPFRRKRQWHAMVF